MTATDPEARRRGRRRGEMTVATIARLAGVSAPTVSKVINGRAGVALDTRRRVEELLREHGYRRPEAVEPAAILEVVFSVLESHLAIEIMRGVESVARAHELAVGFSEMRGRLAPGRGWIEQVLARRPTAVIAVYAGFTPQQQGLLSTSAIPLVALDPTGEPGHAIPSVGATNWSGGVAATRHLLDLGHRRIAKISGPLGFLCARARLDGYRAAMDAAGIPVDPALVRDGAFAFEDGLARGAELLALPDRPTAVFAGNDLQALGVFEAARRAGLRVPQDLSVVGFDDLEFTRWCGPPLTTVRQPLTDMGAAAAELAVGLASGRPPAQTRVELATTLVVRQSTAAPA
ncbi:LacI family DNA-binding transcriptional regulator [Acrocarpospora macrocephala]|nr:LacI family DNA-binding transcriptional regulator [Acrocarpospora macrocephala]